MLLVDCSGRGLYESFIAGCSFAEDGIYPSPCHCFVLQATPKELLFWSHSVQCKIDGVAASLGLYKIKMMGHHGPCCMFASTPEMPAKQQAGVMFTAAKRLSIMLAEVS
jgi:hypothetical protein